MINKKISTIAGSLIILAIVVVLGFSFLGSNKKEETKIQNNVVLDNSDLGNKEVVKQEKEKTSGDTLSKESETTNKKEEKIDTNDWKTCRDEKNGYEFKYPNNWNIHIPVSRVITDCYNQTSLILASEIPEESRQRITFSVIKNASSRENFISQNKAEINIIKELDINGNPALIYAKNGPDGEIKFIKIFKNETSYAITVNQLPSDTIFNALVENFKLLN